MEVYTQISTAATTITTIMTSQSYWASFNGECVDFVECTRTLSWKIEICNYVQIYEGNTWTTTISSYYCSFNVEYVDTYVNGSTQPLPNIQFEDEQMES